jgi:PAS domain S-box-containing protein
MTVIVAFQIVAGILTLVTFGLVIQLIISSARSKSQKYRFLENLAVAVFVVNAKGKPVYANRASYELLGKEADPRLTLPQLAKAYQAYQADTDELYPTERMPLTKALEGKSTTIEDAEIRRPDNTKIYLEVTATPIRDERGKVEYAIAVFQDITTRRTIEKKIDEYAVKLERKFFEQNQQLRDQVASIEREKAEDEALLAGMGEGVVAADKDGKIFFANRQFEQLSGHKEAEIIGKSYAKTVKLEDEAGQPVGTDQRPFNEALEKGKVLVRDGYFLITKDKKRVPVAVTAAPIIIKGQVTGVIDVVRDLTKEQEVDQLKVEFVSLASHQLRTPATAVKGFLAMILQGYSDDITGNQRSLLQQAYVENEQELSLINNLLDVAKVEVGEIRLEPTGIDVEQLVQDVMHELEAQITEREHKVTVKAPKTEVALRADYPKLHMVLTNLVSNAIKYTAKGGQIEVGWKKTGTSVELWVKDSGLGIAKADLSKLFKRFSRLGNPLSGNIGGTGLGLYLVKKIVDLHGGEVTIASAPGHGSTFSVKLPAKGK